MNHRLCTTEGDFKALLCDLWNRKLAKGYFDGSAHAFNSIADFCQFFSLDPSPFMTNEGEIVSSVERRRIKPEHIALQKQASLPSCIFWNFEASWETTGHPKCRIFYVAPLKSKKKVRR